MLEESTQLEIALELLGLKDEIVRSGKTVYGSPEQHEQLGVDGPYCECKRVNRGPNATPTETPVFHYLPAVLEKYQLTPSKAKEVLFLTRGAFSPAIKTKLIDTVCEVLDQMQINFVPSSPRLEWVGNPATLSFIIGELVQKGYIKPPRLDTGDINFKGLAELVVNSFSGAQAKIGKSDTLRRFLNPEDEKGLGQDSQERFKIPYFAEIANNKAK
jgi:hypothetical protein